MPATSPFLKQAGAAGRYWTSGLSRAELQARLRGVDDRRWKTAGVGEDTEESFEQSFSALGYTYIKNRAPRLLDFILGFQLVERNEDETKAMGVFGFKVGDMLLYAPIFFLNGDLKGQELLYIKNQDTFLPSKENWVNYLISRRPHVLGEGSTRSTPELGGMMPNLSRMSHPGMGAKFGSDYGGEVRVDAWARPVLPMLGACATRDPRFLSKHAEAFGRLDLGQILENDFGLLARAHACAQAYPVIKAAFDRHYGPDFFPKAARLARARAAEADSDLVKAAHAGALRAAHARIAARGPIDPLLIPEPRHPIKSGALQIYVRDGWDVARVGEKGAAEVRIDPDAAIAENRPELTEAERNRLLEDPVLIKDRREDGEVSIAYNTQVAMQLANPTESGLFDVLEKPGTFDEMLVILNPHTGRGREDFSLVVRKGDPRAWLNTHHTNLWAKQDPAPDPGAYETWREGLKGVDSLRKGGVYVAVGPRGSGTCPFEVKESYGDDAYKVDWKDYAPYNAGRPTAIATSAARPGDADYGYSSWDAKVRINSHAGSKLRSTFGELAIPQDFKVIEVAKPPEPEDDSEDRAKEEVKGPGGKDEDETDYHELEDRKDYEKDDDIHLGQYGSEARPIEPGNLVHIQVMLHKRASELRVRDLGGDEILLGTGERAGRLTKQAALIGLVRDHGLREPQARALLADAARAATRGEATRCYVKYAQPYSVLQGGPDAPAFPGPWTGSEQAGPNGYPAIYPQEEFQDIPGMDASQTDPSIYDPFYQPDPQAMQQVQQAAASGQKEVFDTSMLGGMLKSVRQDSLVDKYLGDLMKALDRLGRLIFSFYWHQEEFRDRYGKGDIPELEDSLRNAFEGLGDLVLFLRQKSATGGHGVSVGGGGVDADSPSPNISEVARN